MRFAEWMMTGYEWLQRFWGRKYDAAGFELEVAGAAKWLAAHA